MAITRRFWGSSLCLMLAGALASGCGSHTTTSATADPNAAGPATSVPQTHSVSGRASAGPVAMAQVTVYALDASGTYASTLGKTQTDANGSFALEVESDPNALVAIAVSGGTYIEEASTTQVTLASPIRAFIAAQAAANVGVTPLTEIVAQRALATANDANSLVQAVADASYALALATGLPDVTVAPANPNAPIADPNSAGAKYALVLAGLSQVAHGYGSTSLQLTDALALMFAQTGKLDPSAAGTTATVKRTDGTTVTLAPTAWSTELPAAVSTYLTTKGISIGLTATSVTTFNASPPLMQPILLPDGRGLTSMSVGDALGGSVAAGTYDQLTVVGTYTDRSTRRLTTEVNWSTSNTAIASVDGGGRVLAKAPGTVTITATGGRVSQGITLTVTGATLTSIALTDLGGASIAPGTTDVVTATGLFTDGTHQDVSAQATWTSDAATIATVGPHGLVVARAAGTAHLTATLGSVSSQMTLTVTSAILNSLSIAAAHGAAFAAGTDNQLTATGIFNDNSHQPLFAAVVWSTSNAAVASVSPTGLAHGVAAGTATLTATSGTFHLDFPVTVTAATLTSIAVTPPSLTLAAGSSTALAATGTFSDNSTQSLGGATWSSTTPAVATVTAGGTVTAHAAGTAALSVTALGVTHAYPVTVTAATLQGLAVVSAAGSTIAAGTTTQLTATGTFTDATTQALTSSVTWTTSDATKATVTTAGTVRGVAAGNVTLTATKGGVSQTFALTVSTATLSSIAITDASSLSVAVGATDQMTATGTFSDSSTQNITSTVTWSSNAPSVATISSAGQVNGVAAGTATITAVSGGVQRTASVTVH